MTLRLEVFLAFVMALVLASCGLYLKGKHDGAASLRAQFAAVTAAQQGNYERQIKELQGTLALREHDAAALHDEVVRVVERPVYRNVCLDADGVRLANRALGAPTGRTAAKVPATHATR